MVHDLRNMVLSLFYSGPKASVDTYKYYTDDVLPSYVWWFPFDSSPLNKEGPSLLPSLTGRHLHLSS